MANIKYSQEIKNFAFKSYIHNDTDIPTIKKLILEKFEVDISDNTMYQWSSEQGWKELRSKAIARARDQIVSREADHRQLDTEVHLEQYKNLREKATAELKGLQFDRASDAAKAMDMAIKGERTIMEGLIARKFIQGIVSIILEVVSDKDEKRMLGSRLQDFLMEFENS